MATTRSITRDVGPLSLRANISPSTLDTEKRTVQVTWTTGARVRRGFFDPYWEELSLDPKHVRMDRLRNGAPLLDSHDSSSIDSIIGVVDSAQLESARGIATVRFDKGAKGEDAMRRVGEGTLRNLSVGYSTHKMAKVEAGDTAIPVYRAVDWEPYELSLLPMGADAGATVRSEGSARTNPCEFIEERTMDPDITIENPAATPTPAPVLTPNADQVRAAERDRVLGIQRIGRALQRPDAEITAAVGAGTTLEAFRAAATDAFAESQTIQIDKRDPRIEPGADSRDKWLRGASAWIVQRAAVGELVAQHAKATGQTVELDPGEFRGMTLIDLARQSLERAGVRTAGVGRMELVGLALTHRGAGQASTGDFPVLLENTLNKVLLAAYGTTPDTWRRFCKIGSVQDFRASNRYRIGSFGTLSAVNESGEFKNMRIPDGEKQSLTAGTKGAIIAISRQAIINDDLGAFSSLATGFGRAAALTIESDVYATLALNGGLGPALSDGLPLFDAGHNNITAGAALGSNAIDLDRVQMAKQRDVSGNEILSLTPAILLIPINFEGTAKQINNGAYDFDSTKFQTPNKVGGLFRDIVGTARLTGTRRYLLADPAIAPTFEVAFLDGQQQPFLDIQQGWRVDGVEWKVREDYGVAAIDFRGAVTNAGA